jgi:hypothetical protein
LTSALGLRTECRGGEALRMRRSAHRGLDCSGFQCGKDPRGISVALAHRGEPSKLGVRSGEPFTPVVHQPTRTTVNICDINGSPLQGGGRWFKSSIAHLKKSCKGRFFAGKKSEPGRVSWLSYCNRTATRTGTGSRHGSQRRSHRDDCRRRRMVRIFPNREACLRLVTALAVEQSEEWLTGRRYLNMEDLREHRQLGGRLRAHSRLCLPRRERRRTLRAPLQRAPDRVGTSSPLCFGGAL